LPFDSKQDKICHFIFNSF